MAGVSTYSYSTLVTAIRDYTEVDANVFTETIVDGFIMAAQNRINLDLPMDSDRVQAEAQFATDFNSITMPTKALFVRGIEVYESTANTNGQGIWLEKRDQTFISEYVGNLTGTAGGAAAQDVTGLPKYYAMFGGATGLTDTTSGGMYVAPTPDANYKFRVYYNKYPTGLGSGSDGNAETYLSTYFPQGLLYASLAEAYGFLKGPIDMLTLYENKYKNALQQFAGMQLGRRRRDDYTDGTVRIPVKSPSP